MTKPRQAVAPLLYVLARHPEGRTNASTSANRGGTVEALSILLNAEWTGLPPQRRDTSRRDGLPAHTSSSPSAWTKSSCVVTVNGVGL